MDCDKNSPLVMTEITSTFVMSDPIFFVYKTLNKSLKHHDK